MQETERLRKDLNSSGFDGYSVNEGQPKKSKETTLTDEDRKKLPF